MKTKNLFLTLALALFTSFAFSQVSGTPHGFQNAGWNTTGEVCITCHTPHNAIAADGAPLWNHQVSVATYALYTSTTSSTFNGTSEQPGGTSKLCLSCHDGTVDLEAFGGNGAAATNTTISGDVLLGTDLSTHHPVSFVYDALLVTADGGTGLKDPTISPVAPLLFATKVECASCHDAHDNTNSGFLRLSNAASALCLTCHNK